MRKFIFSVLALFISLAGFAYDMPVPKPNEVVVITLNDSQLLSLLSFENYGTVFSPKGSCYGIDRINYTLLTKIKFIHGRRESDASIQDKLLRAYYNHSVQVIRGFYSLDHFMDTMEDEWRKKENPLKIVINVIQNSQSNFEYYRLVGNRAAELSIQGTSYLTQEAQLFEHYILEGIPVSVAIKTEKTAHQITIIGFKHNLSTNEQVKDFYVLDSNDPDTLNILSLKENNWYYKDWEGERWGPWVDVIWKKPTDTEVVNAQKIFKPQVLMSQETLAMLSFKIVQTVTKLW